MVESILFLILFSFGLLIVSIIVIIKAFVEELKEKSDYLLIHIFIIGIVIVLLIALILGIF